MKLKIMIMALLLLAGIGSAVNRLPATEFVGDVTIDSEFILEANANGRLSFDAFGANPHDYADDWQACQDAINATGNPLNAMYGETIMAGDGIYYLSKPLVIDDAGVIIRGSSNRGTLFKPTADFSGDQLFLWNFSHTQSYAMYGAGMYDCRINMDDMPAHAIEVRKACDGTTFQNINIGAVAHDHSAMLFVPDPANTNKVSQGIYLQNVVSYHTYNNSTAPLYYFNRCQEIQLVGAKAFGSIDQVTLAPAHGFEFLDCSGVTMIGCSAAFSSVAAINITTATWPSYGFTILGMTFETIDSMLDVTGTSSYPITAIYMRGTRWLTSSRIDAGTFKYMRYSDIEIGDGEAVFESSSYYNQYVSQKNNASRVTDVGGSNYGISPFYGTGFMKVSTPGFRWTTARNDYWTFVWSASAVADNKLLLRKYDGASTTTIFKFDDAPSTGATGLFIYENDAGTLKLSQVVSGADDSGGEGYRMLRVAN